MGLWKPLTTALFFLVTGPAAFGSAVEYNANLAVIGLQGPRKDGETAGTTGEGKPMEGIRIWTKVFGDNGYCQVRYQVHMAAKGWGDQVANGTLAGTEGESRPIEGIRIWLENCPSTRGILYRVHETNFGWQAWVSNGAVAGTTGQAIPIEAIEIKLSGNGDLYPDDTPDKLRINELWSRCSGSTDAISRSTCADVTRSTTGACLSDSDRHWAMDKGLSVYCSGNAIVSACPCGCFEKGTRILSTDEHNVAQWVPVESAQGGTWVRTLARESQLSQLHFIDNLVSYRTRGPEEADLYTFKTALGQTLSVTQNHAILLSDGRMVRAKDVRASDILMTSDGQPTALTSITRHHTSDDVFNVLIDRPATSPIEHLMFAEGLIVGDLQWQNALSFELDQVMMRQ